MFLNFIRSREVPSKADAPVARLAAAALPLHRTRATGVIDTV
jgi:hypothetical protein